jgi:outer membrane murein-binding lipoprotein Lpp
MRTKTSLLHQAGLGVLATLLLTAGAQAKPVRHAKHGQAPAAASALKRQVDELEAQIAALQVWRNAQASEHAQADQQIATLRQQLAESQAQSQATLAEAREQIQTIPGAVRSEIAAEQPKDGKIHYKGVTLTLGGFAAAEGVYRSRNEEADIGSSFSGIPFGNNVLSHVDELRGTARQSRLSLLAEGDINPDTHAAFYTELDFLAGPQTGNSKESNSFSPRIRNVYGTLDMGNVHLLAGQNWSLATMNTKGITPRNEAPPPTIDAQYVVGFTWARQPQIRLATDFDDKQLWAAVSLENPQTTFASAATGTTGGTSVPNLTVTTGAASTSQFDSANTLSLNHIPDVIGKLAFEPDFGGSRPLHLEVYGLFRSYLDRVNATAANLAGVPVGVANDSTNGGGVGGGVMWTVVPKLVDLQASVLSGRGIGRYGSAQFADTVVGPNGALKPIPETMYLVGGTLHATPALDVYVFGGGDSERSVVSTFGGKSYGFGSPTATLANCSVEGATCSPDVKSMSQIAGGLWDKVYQGSFGSVRVGLQYSYTKLTAFTGATGGAPKTDDNMIFTSFRYYPF